ncbi:hypothetical protein BDQ17DRAFT_1357878 [Cyathus striatus]|nr:hypothetical protein BDQ17DRAFT_1357878 [Cyathus striatus]
MASTAGMPVYMLPGVTVQQPPHLEGDPSLATEILPGPPSLASAQQASQKRDPRKPSTIYSYLPHSDPGSTYSGIMHGTLIGQEPEGPRTKRSRVDKGTAAGRAQRASARNQNGAIFASDPHPPPTIGTTPTPQISVDIDGEAMLVDDELSMTRSSSTININDSASQPTTSSRSRRKDKGKCKETEATPIRVKEEPKAVSLNSPEPVVNLLNNEDHCSSCRSHGALVYCDGCPKAFHLWCLDPPMESVDEGDSRWFCPSCIMRKNPPKKPPPSLLSPLIHQLQTSIPVEFQLPEDIRSFFKDVATGPRGAYVDASEVKQPRLNRHGQLEDRDPYRLRDRNGTPILCFKCGMSALPNGLAATAPALKRIRRSTATPVGTEAWKSIVSCDYCNLHWHLDCLDPPLSSMPSYNKKWMCPNHAERVLPLKRRIPKQNAPPIDIIKPRQFNNGNIEIIHPEIPISTQNAKIPVDEVLINGRRYRVPERIIVLDFWNKLNRQDPDGEGETELPSGMSSPLTSLSSLEDLEDRNTAEEKPTSDLMEIAQMLSDLRSRKSQINGIQPAASTSRSKSLPSQHPCYTEQEVVLPQPVATTSSRPSRGAVPKRPLKNASNNGTTNGAAAPSSETVNSTSTSTFSKTRRRRTIQHTQPEPSTRELRSRSRNHNAELSLPAVITKATSKRSDELVQDVDSCMPAPTFPQPAAMKPIAINVKLEEADNHHLLNGISEPSSSQKVLTRRPRMPRRVTQKETEEPRKEIREKRGRKRKERDDELPSLKRNEGRVVDDPSPREREERKERQEREKPDKETQKRKSIRTPTRQSQTSLQTGITPLVATSSNPAPTTPATPSLKIRLPRLSNLGIQTTSNGIGTSADTPARL